MGNRGALLPNHLGFDGGLADGTVFKAKQTLRLRAYADEAKP